MSHPTVVAVRADLIASGEVEDFSTRVGRDGVEQPARKPVSQRVAEKRKAEQKQGAKMASLPTIGQMVAEAAHSGGQSGHLSAGFEVGGATRRA